MTRDAILAKAHGFSRLAYDARKQGRHDLAELAAARAELAAWHASRMRLAHPGPGLGGHPTLVLPGPLTALAEAVVRRLC